MQVENRAKANMTNATVNKSGGATSNKENSDFYGQNAAVLVRDGSTLSLSGTTASSSGQGEMPFLPMARIPLSISRTRRSVPLQTIAESLIILVEPLFRGKD